MGQGRPYSLSRSDTGHVPESRSSTGNNRISGSRHSMRSIEFPSSYCLLWTNQVMMRRRRRRRRKRRRMDGWMDWLIDWLIDWLMNEWILDSGAGDENWRMAYTGQATSVPLRMLLYSATDDDDNDEYACRVTSRNHYGWSAPSDVLMFNADDALTPGKLSTVSGQP